MRKRIDQAEERKCHHGLAASSVTVNPIATDTNHGRFRVEAKLISAGFLSRADASEPQGSGHRHRTVFQRLRHRRGLVHHLATTAGDGA